MLLAHPPSGPLESRVRRAADLPARPLTRSRGLLGALGLALLLSCTGSGEQAASSTAEAGALGGAAGGGDASTDGLEGGTGGTADGAGGSAGGAGAGGGASECPGAGGSGGTDVHLQPQHKSSALLFDPAKDSFNVSYHSFRIPSVVRTKAGTLLAFAEGRRCSHLDFGDINLVYKRSVDHGKTWSSLKEVIGQGAGTWGNPTAVVDFDTGRIWLFMSWNAGDKSQNGGTNPCTDQATDVVGVGDRAVKLTYSDDDGASWTSVIDQTQALQPPNKMWDAMGPGVGIQATCGPVPGRLIVPAIGRNIYSDDHGKSWTYASIPAGTSEGTVVELSTGTLLRNDRAVGGAYNGYRKRSRGVIPHGFEAFSDDVTLIDPRVEGSAIRYSLAPHRILFLNPANNDSDAESARCRMRVRVSYDDGGTWPVSRLLHDPLSAAESCTQKLGGYSSLAATADEHVVALSERVESGAGNHRGIEVHRFNLSWVLNGTPEPL